MSKKESNPIPEGAIKPAPPPPPPLKTRLICEDGKEIIEKTNGIVPCSKCGSYAIGHYYYGYSPERSYIQCSDCGNEVLGKTPKIAWEKWEKSNGSN